LQTAVAKRLQKWQQRKKEREREEEMFMDTTNPTKILEKKREKKGTYLVRRSIIKIPKMTQVKKKEARLEHGT
jgi:hypothetical protein